MKEKIAVCGLLFCLCAGTTWALDDTCATPLSEAQLADHWVASEGVAPDKDSAIDKAIKRAISMVYGEIMSAETELKKHTKELNASGPDGETNARVSEKDLKTRMDTKTAGFVREYKVISVVPTDSGLRAHVHARIINPRVGVDGVILVTKPESSISLQSELIKVGPGKTVSGRELGNIAENALCGALADSHRFIPRTVKDIKAAVANNRLTTTLVGAGMVPSSELLQAGKILMCDYILSSRIEEISYSKKLGKDKKTKKFGQIQTMKVKICLKLTDVRAGSTAANDTLTLSLDNEQIKSMQETDEDADLFRGVLGGLVEPLTEWIKAHTN